ncbi:MAG: 4-hydroxy-tetrahydrodipicolinate synthase [Acidobacteriota bacterium]|jgi:4-hydroxy-tetrahydrodipicolinate synthase|nr:MAG: 4-hydroxy-tetrahydrodipicolinate synthase [Acidobacteriota bacterium]
MRSEFTGLGTALVTPFTRNGAVDEAAVRRLAERQVEAGVHFLVPCGTTGESPTLSAAEKVRIVELTVEAAAGRALVLAGAGGYDTREVIETVRAFERAGAHGILSVSPYYNKPTQEGLFQHYKAIAESTSLPVIVYNVPGRTGSNVEPATLERLAAVPNIVGVKEASGNMAQIVDVCRRVPEDFLVLSGDDALTLPVMAVGGRGVISVIANEAPAEMVELVEAAERGEFAHARRVHARLASLMLANFVESNPIPVKAAMAAMGLCEEVYRLPLVPPSDASRERVLAALREAGLQVTAAARG